MYYFLATKGAKEPTLRAAAGKPSAGISFESADYLPADNQPLSNRLEG